MSLLKGVKRLLTHAPYLLTCVSCSTGNLENSPYLFSRGKQRHEVLAFGPQGQVNSRSTNFLILDDEQASLTSVSPALLTIMRATASRNSAGEILYLSPLLEKQRPIFKELLKRLSKLLWIKAGEVPGEIHILKYFEDGTAREIEWSLAQQKIRITVERL